MFASHNLIQKTFLHFLSPMQIRSKFFSSIYPRLWAAILCIIFVAAGEVSGQKVKAVPVLGFNNDRNLKIRAKEKFGIDFVELRTFSDLIGSKTYYNNLAQKIVVYLGDHKVKVTAVNPFVVIDDQVYQMPVSTLFDSEGIWVPIRFFIDVIAPYSSTPLSYDNESGTIALVSAGTNIHAIALEEKVNGLLIRIASIRSFDPAELAVRLNENWLYLDIYGGTVDTNRLAIEKPLGIIKKMVPVQFEESAQLCFRLSKSLDKSSVSVSSGDGEVLLSIRTSDDIPKDFIVDFAEEKQKWLIDKIIIDPGHGGKDPGTLGYGNLKEKDVVLDIAKRLKRLLEGSLNVDVQMTREKDEFVELRERSAFANRNAGKLFIGIHANSNPSSRASGMETYILGTARTNEDREIAEKENSVIRYEDSWAPYGDLSNENAILVRMAQSSFEQESQELAALVQGNAKKTLNTRDRGVKQAGFYVMVGTSMPKIYVEVGFISNKREARRLRTKDYRQKIAEAIFKGVEEFKRRSESFILESATQPGN